MDDEVKVAILEQKQEVLEQFVGKLDSAIEKIAEVNTNVSKMLAVHEEKISKQEEKQLTKTKSNQVHLQSPYTPKEKESHQLYSTPQEHSISNFLLFNTRHDLSSCLLNE